MGSTCADDVGLMEEKSVITKEDFIKIAKLFLENVDGGCGYCARDAAECLMSVYRGDFDWEFVFKEVMDERYT